MGAALKQVIHKGRIILGSELLEGYDLLIKDGRIFDVAKSTSSYPTAFEVLDASGLIVSPGLIDIHNPGAQGADAMDASQESLSKIAHHHISHGVTSFLATLITAPLEDLDRAYQAVKIFSQKQGLEDKPGARLLGVYQEGPFYNPAKLGAQNPAYLAAADLGLLDQILKISQGQLKIMSLAPELPDGLEIIRRLRSEEVIPALGHSEADYQTSKEAVEAGAELVTHLYNGMGSLHHREPGLLGVGLTDDRLYAELIADLVHVHPAAIKLALRAKGYDRVILISDSMRAAGLEDGTYDLGGLEVRVKDKIPRLPEGNLAGSVLNLQAAIKNLVNQVEVPLAQAIKMASTNPAKILGLDQDLGSLEPGRIADLILLDDNLEIQKVFLAGRQVR